MWIKSCGGRKIMYPKIIIKGLHILIVLKLLYFVHGHQTPGHKLMLFLMDGFKWDYIDHAGLNLPGFRKLLQQGVRAEYMIPDFPSLSYPNYYSIMTGLHVENHGMVGNFMYDKKHDEKFLVGMNKEQYHSYWWDDGEPLWVTAEKEKRHVYMYHWPGCEVTIRGVNPTYCKKYNILLTPHVKQMKAAINEGLQLFQNGSADVVGIYLETLDKYGHQYGVNSAKLNHALEEVDKEIDSLLDKLKTWHLEDDVNIMIFSDHGMTNLSESRVISITESVNPDDIEVMLDFGPTVNIWPKEDKIDKVYNDLKKINNRNLLVYKKEELPDRWHFGKHPRVPPIFLVAKNGWYITTPLMKKMYKYFGTGVIRGSHGYDNKESDMRSVFFATGPDFRKNVVTEPFVDVHLYQVMCEILGIHAAPNNGSWQVAKQMLAPKSSYVQTYFTDDIVTEPQQQTTGTPISAANNITLNLFLKVASIVVHMYIFSVRKIQIHIGMTQ